MTTLSPSKMALVMAGLSVSTDEMPKPRHIAVGPASISSHASCNGLFCPPSVFCWHCTCTTSVSSGSVNIRLVTPAAHPSMVLDRYELRYPSDACMLW